MTSKARRLGLAVAGIGFAAIAAFATAGPAAADNGPHVAVNGNVSMAGGCASCHRIHASQNFYYQLREASAGDLCATCHGSGAPGSNTDVYNGVNTANTTGHQALRGGGFVNASIGSSNVVYTGSKSAMTIGVLNAPESSTSQHQVEGFATGWTGVGTLWGAETTTTSSSTLECTSCHDPHGNGGYRILRPIGVATNLVSQSLVTNTFGAMDTLTIDTVGTGDFTSETITSLGASTKYTWIFHLSAGQTQKFTPGTVITVRQITAANDTATACIASSQVTKVTLTTVELGYQSASPVGNALCTGTLYAMPAFPTTLYYSQMTSASVVRFYTVGSLGLRAGQRVSIYSAKDNKIVTGLARVAVTSATSVTAKYGATYFEIALPSTFADTTTVASAFGGGIGSGTGAGNLAGRLYYIAIIPDANGSTNSDALGVDAASKRLYTTTNFWAADDHGDTTTIGQTTPYVASIAQWCSSCHTKYLSMGSSGRKFANTEMDGTIDNVFTFRHTSGEVVENGKNCITCHVSHGSNASMAQVVTSGALAVKFPGSVINEDSALLRVDNRGICLFCHASNVNAL